MEEVLCVNVDCDTNAALNGRLCWSNESLVNTCQPHLAGNPSQQSIVAKRYGKQNDGAVGLLSGN
jgi:hypothetical protein